MLINLLCQIEIRAEGTQTKKNILVKQIKFGGEDTTICVTETDASRLLLFYNNINLSFSKVTMHFSLPLYLLCTLEMQPIL